MIKKSTNSTQCFESILQEQTTENTQQRKENTWSTMRASQQWPQAPLLKLKHGDRIG
jgi:hypothetical protein